MDYNKIKYFLKAAETLNFSEASRQMFITPQAFGRQIAALEQEMGFRLFERNGKKIRLTSSGKICYENLSGIVANLEREYEKMCEMGTKRKRQINIGIFQALSLKKVVSPIVAGILSRYPDWNINISLCDMKELIEQMKYGKLDLCITVTHKYEPEWKDCDVITLKRVPARIVVSNYHPWVVKDSVTIEDMKNNIFTKMDMPGFSEKDYFINIPCKEQSVAPNYESMCLRLEQGDCFTLMSADVDSYCEKNGKALALPWSPFDFNLVIICNPNNLNKSIPEICHFILEEFEL